MKLALEGTNSSWSERSEEHTSELQSPCNLVCRLLLEKKKIQYRTPIIFNTPSPSLSVYCCAASTRHPTLSPLPRTSHCTAYTPAPGNNTKRPLRLSCT